MLEQQLVVGRTYRFSFKAEFERHGVCTTEGLMCLHKGNGVFRLEQIATFVDIVKAAINLYENFFKPLGISQAEYQSYFSGRPANSYIPEFGVQQVPVESTVTEVIRKEDGSNVTINRKVTSFKNKLYETGNSRLQKKFIEDVAYGSYPIYKLVDVKNPDDIIYAPEKTIKGMPEVSIKSYKDVTMMVQLGYYEDPTQLDGMVHAIREHLALFGVRPLNLQLVSADERWMNKDEYDKTKEIKLPGTLVKITKDNKDSYINKSTIVAGGVRTIVQRDPEKPDEKFDPETQIDIEELICKNQTLDPMIFLRAMDPAVDNVFISEGMYYKKSPNYDESTNKSFIRLVEGEDWQPGDPVDFYVETTDKKAKAGKRYFADYGVQYAAFPTTVDYKVVIAYIDSGKNIYFTEDKYIQQSEFDVAEPNEEYYTLDNGQYVKQKINPGAHLSTEYYKKAFGYVKADKNYVENNKDQQYLLKVTDHNYQELEIEVGSDIEPDTYELTEHFMLDFGSEAGQNLLGKTFKYTNRIGQLVETEIDASEVVDASLDVSQKIKISNQIVANKYVGRWFEYTRYDQCLNKDDEPDYYRTADGKHQYFIYDDTTGEYVKQDVAAGTTLSKTYYVMRTLDVVISESNWKDYPAQTGVIMGQTGEVWRDTYIITDELNKNYFALYQNALQVQEVLTKKNQALQDLVNKLAANQKD